MFILTWASFLQLDQTFLLLPHMKSMGGLSTTVESSCAFLEPSFLKLQWTMSVQQVPSTELSSGFVGSKWKGSKKWGSPNGISSVKANFGLTKNTSLLTLLAVAPFISLMLAGWRPWKSFSLIFPLWFLFFAGNANLALCCVLSISTSASFPCLALGSH